MAKYVLTPRFRVSYPNVFTAKRNELSGKDEYSLVALFAKNEKLQVLEAEVLRAAKDKWGEGATITKTPQGTYQLVQPGKPGFAIRLPFRDQGDRAGSPKGLPAGYEPGALFINLKSSERPSLVDQRKQEIVDKSVFYAGCYAIAAVNAFAYDQKGNRGVSLGLQAIQKVGEGDPLGNRVRAEECFEAIEETETGADASSLFGT